MDTQGYVTSCSGASRSNASCMLVLGVADCGLVFGATGCTLALGVDGLSNATGCTKVLEGGVTKFGDTCWAELLPDTLGTSVGPTPLAAFHWARPTHS